MSATIQVSNLTKSFKDLKAVNDLSFTVNSGEVYGFLGQNGAGKSTTIRMLLTLIRPDYGNIEIFGLNLQHHRKEILSKVGAIIERPDLYKYLNAYENLKIFATLSGVRLSSKQIMDRLAMVGLAERAKSKLKTFSQGMKQRLGIAVALVNNPDLIILDEPSNGLDPQGIADIRQLILHLSREEGKTLVISSHLLAEMELIADSMLIIDKGKKLVEGRTDELLHPAEILVEIISDNKDSIMNFLSTSAWSDTLMEEDGKILLRTSRNEIPKINTVLVEQGFNIYSIRPKHSLEDYFLSLTGNK